MPLAAALVAVSLLAAPAPPPVPPAVLEALVWHESRGNPRVVNRFGCVGLTQICLRILPACRTPAGLAAPGCLAERARLLDPTENRREALKQLAGWRAYCLKTTGRARRGHPLRLRGLRLELEGVRDAAAQGSMGVDPDPAGRARDHAEGEGDRETMEGPSRASTARIAAR